MASRISELLLKISGEDRLGPVLTQVNRDLKVAVDQAKRSSVGFEALGSSLKSVGQTLAVGFSLPVAGFAAASVKFAADLEALKLGLKAVTGSAEEAERQFTDLREVAKLPGLGLEEAVRGATNLQAVGFSASKSKDILLQFGNALASVGRGREDLDETIRQLGQLGSRGVVTADNLKPLIERVPQLATIIKTQFGPEAIGDPAKTFERLGVSSAQFIEIVLAELGKVPRVTGGLKNDFENLHDSIKLSLAEAGNALAPFAKQLVDEFAVPSIQKIAELARSFNDLSPAVKSAIVVVGGIATLAPLVIAFTGTMIQSLVSIKTAMIATGIQAGLLKVSLTSFAALAAVGTIIALANAFRELRQAQELADQTTKEQLQSIQELIFRARQHAGANKEQQAEISRLASEYDSLKISGAELRTALVALAGVKPAVTTETRNLAKATEEATVAIAKYTGVARGQTAESGVIAAMLSRLQANYRSLTDQVAALRLNTEDSNQAFAQLPPILGDVGAGVFRVASGYDHLQAVIDATNQGLSNHADELKRQRDEIGQFDQIIRRQTSGMDPAMDATRRATQGVSRAAQEMGRQVSSITTDLSRSLADLAFEGGKLKDRLSDAFESIGKSLLRAAIESQLQRISKLVIDIASNIPGVGKALGAIFGVGGGATGGAAQAAGGAASAAGSIAGQAASIGGQAAGAGATAIVGAVSGVVSAVSGVISNFQFAGMNKSLDIIVQHTLQTANQLRDGLQPQVNAYLPYLELIHERLMNVLTTGVGVYNAPGRELYLAGAAGGFSIGEVHFHADGGDHRAMFAEFVQYLKDHGIGPRG